MRASSKTARRVIVSLFLVVASLTSVAVPQQRWVPTANKGEELDTLSVVALGNDQFRVWLRVVAGDSLLWMQQYEYDCRLRQSRMIRYMGYYGKPTPSQDWDYERTATSQAIVPGSIGEASFKSACAFALKRKHD